MPALTPDEVNETKAGAYRRLRGAVCDAFGADPGEVEVTDSDLIMKLRRLGDDTRKFIAGSPTLAEASANRMQIMDAVMANPDADVDPIDVELRHLRQYREDTERMMEGVPAMQYQADGAVVFAIPTLGNLQQRAHQTSIDHGWWEGVDPFDPMVAGAKIALMHSELSECLEELRKPDCSEDLVAEELGDTIIRILDFAGARGLDLQGAVLKKMAKNDARPHRHGGKKL